jgi:hypothetical protein
VVAKLAPEELLLVVFYGIGVAGCAAAALWLYCSKRIERRPYVVLLLPVALMPLVNLCAAFALLFWSVVEYSDDQIRNPRHR